MSWGDTPWGSGPFGDAPGTPAAPIVDAPNSTGQQTAAEKQELRRLGADILFTFEEELPVGANADYILVKGLENLRRAILRRLLTRPGDYAFVPEYGVGIPSFLKKRRTQTTIKQLEADIRENLLRESRIEEVTDVAVENIPDGIKVNVQVRASGRNLRFRPFTFSQEDV